MNDLITRAAQARAAGVAARADRPSQRRCAEATDSQAWVRVTAALTLRDAATGGGSGWDFHGVASVVEHAYEMWDWFGPYTEIVDAGAFVETLNRVDLDVPLVLGHDQLRRLARTTNGSLTLSLDDSGSLVVDAPNLDPADVDVAYIAPKLRAGLIDEMSFAFRIDAGEWSPDYSQYRITKVDIHRGDVAIVGYGANPATSGGLRDAAPAHDLRALPLLTAAIATGRRP